MIERIHVRFDPLLETGDAAIDEMHRELFARIDRLLEATRSDRSREEVGYLLEFLGDYVVEHFTYEEDLMSSLGFPGLEHHRTEHQRFVQDFALLHREFRTEGPSRLFVIRVGNRVTAWLRDHIYRTDRALAEWLKVRRGDAR